MKKKIIVALLLILLINVVILVLSPREGKKEIVPSPLPSATPFVPSEKIDESYNASFNKIAPQIRESDKKSSAVGALLDKLPHQETHMVLSYDINKNIFTATIDSSDREMGLAQLDAVLKVNGIESRSWIENLEIVYE